MNQYETGTSGVIAVDADRRALRQPPKLRLMLDMETLGTAPRSVITEIAVVDIDDPQRFFFHNLDIDAQLAMGRTVDGATLRWWMAQPAVPLVKKDREVVPVNFFTDLTFWRRKLVGGDDVSAVEWWCKGASFDFLLLLDLYAQLGGHEDQLWYFPRLMCFRTVARREDPTRQSEPEFVGRRHDALADAQHQAAWLRKIEWKREVTCE